MNLVTSTPYQTEEYHNQGAEFVGKQVLIVQASNRKNAPSNKGVAKWPSVWIAHHSNLVRKNCEPGSSR